MTSSACPTPVYSFVSCTAKTCSQHEELSCILYCSHWQGLGQPSAMEKNESFNQEGLNPGGGGTLNVEVIGMLVRIFSENPKKYPDFDFKPLKNTQIAIFRVVLGKMASIFQKFSRRP